MLPRLAPHPALEQGRGLARTPVTYMVSQAAVAPRGPEAGSLPFMHRGKQRSWPGGVSVATSPLRVPTPGARTGW